MKRLFVSVPVDGSALEGVSSHVRECMGQKPTSLGNAHITLLFIGDYPESGIEGLMERLEDAVSVIESFSYSLEGVGKFPKKGSPRVLWVGAKGHGFDRLHEAACKALGKTPDKEFVPHVTLCRVRKHIDPSPFLAEFKDTVFWEGFCKNVQLMESALGGSGARHTLVRNYRL